MDILNRNLTIIINENMVSAYDSHIDKKIQYKGDAEAYDFGDSYDNDNLIIFIKDICKQKQFSKIVFIIINDFYRYSLKIAESIRTIKFNDESNVSKLFNNWEDVAVISLSHLLHDFYEKNIESSDINNSCVFKFTEQPKLMWKVTESSIETIKNCPSKVRCINLYPSDILNLITLRDEHCNSDTRKKIQSPIVKKIQNRNQTSFDIYLNSNNIPAKPSNLDNN